MHFAGHGQAVRQGSTESYAMVLQGQNISPLAWRAMANEAVWPSTLF